MGSISFNEIPATIRLPAVLVEIDNSKAVGGSTLMPYTNLVVGQRLAAGTVAAATPIRVTTAAQARAYFGAGSLLALMCETQLANNEITETWAVALDDDAASAKAAGAMTFSGDVTASGTLFLYVAGQRLKIGVAAGQDAAVTAAAVVAAIAAAKDLPVTAAVDGAVAGKVNLTARNAGETGNVIDVRVNYYDGEALPAGLAIAWGNGGGTVDGSPTPPWLWAAATAGQVSYSANIDPARPFKTLALTGVLAPKTSPGMRLAGGTANPDIGDVFAAIGDKHCNVLTVPWIDAANLHALHVELLDRWTGLRMIEGMAFVGAYGTMSAIGTLGDSLNSPFISIADATGGRTFAESNLLLFDGVSVYSTDADGTVRIWQIITTYKTTASGAEDISYLKVNTILTLGYLRYDWRNLVLREFPRHKLANDGVKYKPTQAIVTPKILRARAATWLMEKAEDALVENVDAAIAAMVVERNDDNPDRADMYLPPDIVNQFDILATQLGFRL